MSTAKLHEITIRSDFKWHDQIDIITAKAANLLYLLRQLKKAGIGSSDQVKFYPSVIRSVLSMHVRFFTIAYLVIYRIVSSAFRGALCR